MLSRAEYSTSCSSAWPANGSETHINSKLMKTAPAPAPINGCLWLASRREGRMHCDGVHYLLPFQEGARKIPHRLPGWLERTRSMVKYLLSLLAFVGLFQAVQAQTANGDPNRIRTVVID